jgi:hypothetical protein
MKAQTGKEKARGIGKAQFNYDIDLHRELQIIAVPTISKCKGRVLFYSCII